MQPIITLINPKLLHYHHKLNFRKVLILFRLAQMKKGHFINVQF